MIGSPPQGLSEAGRGKSSGSMTSDFPTTNNFFSPENVLYINLAGVRSVRWISE